MFRHIFIGVVKPKAEESKINDRLKVMKSIAKEVGGVTNFAAGRNLGWYTPDDTLILTGDFESKEARMKFVNSDYHMQKLAAVAGEVFDMDKSAGYQFEF
ncbi:MAG: Dabb family protein [Muribaculaceae bacterium]|nr:Dabb family protein [Muribaculaceae bacterium]